MTPAHIGFLVLSAVCVAGALGAVIIKNIARALLSVVTFFFGVAGLFFMMHAEFVGVVQLLVYVGAIAVLIIFAIVLTRAMETPADVARIAGWRPLGIATAVAVAAVIIGVILKNPDVAAPPAPGQTAGAEEIGQALMTRYVVPFEVASVLLTATLIGAVVIALDETRRRKR